MPITTWLIAYFNLQDYANANDGFRKFLTTQQGLRGKKIADAYTRLGDCYFLERNYPLAIENYEKAYSLQLHDPDYALFQVAFCEGLNRNQNEKITKLRKLLNDYPDSPYRDDALYELGRANERLNNITEATRQYSEIIDNHQQSNYYKKALVQMGLLNFNSGNFSQSLKLYKKVVEEYPNSEEAQEALNGIRNNYVEMNDVDAYFAYTRQLGTGVVVTASEQDQLIFQAAEKQFMAGDKNAIAQFKRYLGEFPYGAYVLNANFYLGEALYANGQYSEALPYYMQVVSQGDNIFSENALAKAAELTINAKDYKNALPLYERAGKPGKQQMEPAVGQCRQNEMQF